MNKVQRAMTVGCLLMVTMLFAGCSKAIHQNDAETFLKTLKCYQAEVKVSFLKDLQPNEMEMKQTAVLGGSYEMEIKAPSHMQGVRISYDGNQITQYHPNSQKEVACEVNPARNEIMLISFVERYLESKEVKKETIQLNGKSIIAFEMPIEGGYKYLAKERLWLDAATLEPVQMSIYDETGNVTLQVEYESFKYNF